MQIILLNKPVMVLCQFSPHEGKRTLSDFISQPDVYPAGRLDYDSEGLLLLTGNGRLQHQLSDPRHKLPKTYWVQVEGRIHDDAIEQLARGVQLKDGLTHPATAQRIEQPANLWQREPPIRYRANIPTSWLSLTLTEGRNRQVRRMTAAVGFPTLRLIRHAIGPWQLGDLAPGQSCLKTVPKHLMPKPAAQSQPTSKTRTSRQRKPTPGRKRYQRSRDA